MLTIAEDTLSPAGYVRFKEQYNKLSAEGFSSEEKTAVSNIQGCENEIVALERFLKKEDESED
jgi:phage-related protein